MQALPGCTTAVSNLKLDCQHKDEFNTLKFARWNCFLERSAPTPARSVRRPPANAFPRQGTCCIGAVDLWVLRTIHALGLATASLQRL